MSMANEETRTERDSMGEMEVPAAAYYGASTQRAVLNFPISDLRFPRRFIQALGLIKQKAAETNQELGLLDERLAGAIIQAAQEVVDGTLDGEFVLDIFQTGSGTSTNMNANEVIANRAVEILGEERGSRTIHPNDHVNICQSSNDVIPAAMHLSALLGIREDLIPALAGLQRALVAKSEEFMPIIKTGRTHLQDATPYPLGAGVSGLRRPDRAGHKTPAPCRGLAGRNCPRRHGGRAPASMRIPRLRAASAPSCAPRPATTSAKRKTTFKPKVPLTPW